MFLLANETVSPGMIVKFLTSFFNFFPQSHLKKLRGTYHMSEVTNMDKFIVVIDPKTAEIKTKRRK